MRKTFILILIIYSCIQFGYAENENFYLNIRIPPENIIPSALNVQLRENETVQLYVDLVPKFADDSKIVWECIPPYATVAYQGKNCTLTAKNKGDAMLIARDENGAGCEIKIKILPQKTEISIKGENDTIKIGEQTTFTVHTEPETTVRWQVDCGDIARASYGGSKCRISAKSAGTVKISAIAENGEKAVKTLVITPPDEMNISLFGTVLGIVSILLLSIAFISYLKLRRENEK